MTTTETSYEIRWPDWYDWRAELEMADKGYFRGPFVDFADGPTYELFFFDPVRLTQELDIEVARGVPFLFEVNMIVVLEVTPAAIREAIDRLVRKGDFRRLKPVSLAPA